MQTVNIKVSDYRAVWSADVGVNGIAVLAGPNGSGKSTLLRLLYHTLRCAVDYDRTVDKWFRDELLDVGYLVEKITKELPTWSPLAVEMPALCDDDTDWRERARRYKDTLDTAIEVFAHLPADEPYQTRMRQYYNIAKDTVLHYSGQWKNIMGMMKMVVAEVEKLRTDTERTVARRGNKPYNHAVRRRCGDVMGHVSVEEAGVPVYGAGTEYVPMLADARHVFYTDGPLRYDNLMTALKMPLDDAERDLVEDLSRDVKWQKGDTLDIFTSMLGGKVHVGDDGTLRFKDSTSDVDISLRQAASGIQSIGTLALLRERDMFKGGDFVIIDEPEMHLHPEMAVELAKMVIEMHRKIGTRFVIATHSTDVVSSLRYISEKEGLLDKVDFYLAENVGNGKYNYRATGIDIDPIFESFNLALDKLAEYGTEF